MTNANQDLNRGSAPVSQTQYRDSGNRRGTAERSDTVQVVEFVLGKEHFALDLFNVKEVVEYKTITQLPNTPAYIRGIIDLRGEITVIIDLKERMNMHYKGNAVAENCKIIVLDDSITKSKTGIIVDNVSSVTTFDRSAVDTGTYLVEQGESAIIGIIKKRIRIKDRDANELLILIDLKQLVSDEPMNVNLPEITPEATTA
jgi:purine-binding chemotaxis protein CheW